MCVVSTAKGDPYLPISSSRIVPEPKHDTYSAVVPAIAQARVRRSAWRTTWAAGPASSSGQPSMSCWWLAVQELELAQLALLVEFLDEEELAAVHHRLHHHVLQAGLLLQLRRSCGNPSTLVAMGTVQATCLPAFSAAMDCRAWSGMGVLMWTASTFGSREQRVEVGVPPLARRTRRPRRRAFLVAAADRVQLGMRVALVDGNELGAETEAHDSHVDFLLVHHTGPLFASGSLRPLWTRRDSPSMRICALQLRYFTTWADCPFGGRS